MEVEFKKKTVTTCRYGKCHWDHCKLSRETQKRKNEWKTNNAAAAEGRDCTHCKPSAVERDPVRAELQHLLKVKVVRLPLELGGLGAEARHQLLEECRGDRESLALPLQVPKVAAHDNVLEDGSRPLGVLRDLVGLGHHACVPKRGVLDKHALEIRR